MKVLNIGLIKGRHELPVEKYIFDEIKDVLDFNSLQERADRFVKELVAELDATSEKLINGYEENKYSYHDVTINIYVTGLTAATIAAYKAIDNHGAFKEINFMHYNNASGQYIAQNMYR